MPHSSFSFPWNSTQQEGQDKKNDVPFSRPGARDGALHTYGSTGRRWPDLFSSDPPVRGWTMSRLTTIGSSC